MQNEIKLLNVKLDYLTDGNRRLHGLYDVRGERIKNLEYELDTCQNQNSGNQVLERMIEGIDQNTLSNRYILYPVLLYSPYYMAHIIWIMYTDIHHMV